MNFVAQWKTICDRINDRDVPLSDQEVEIDKKYIVFEVRHSIHKRSLPVKLDKPIMWGLAESEAQFILAKILKTKTVESEDEKHIIYYDMVREDGVRSSVYDNPPGIIIQDSSTTEFDLWINK